MKNKMLLSLVVGFLAFTPSSKGAVNDVLFVLLGGYTSCGSAGPTGIGMYGPFLQMKKNVKLSSPVINIHYLVACLGNVKPPQGQAQYILSDEPNRELTGSTAVIMNEIENLISKKNISAVFIAGHSYGGFMAMYMMERLQYSGKVSGLFTVDPISTQCGPMQVAFGAKVCHQAPDDFNNKTIRERVGNWVNFYQTQDTWLTSSSIAEAENMHVQMRGPHTQVDSHPLTWQRISGIVTGKLTSLGVTSN